MDLRSILYFCNMSATTAFAGSVPLNYDQYLGPVLFEPYAIDIAGRINAASYSNVLEIACGTGRVTRHLVAALPADGKIIASDLNEDMINVARHSVKDARVKWMVADAQDLPFPDENFDHIICQFGVMFFPDKARAFAEAHRVLAPGGRFVFNVWDSMENNPRSAVIRTVLEELLGDEAPDFLSKGPYSFYDTNQVFSLLQQAGFKKIQLELVQKITYYATADDLIKGFVDGSPLNAYLAQQPVSVQQLVREKLHEHIVNQFGATQVISPMQAFVCSAERGSQSAVASR